MLFPSRHPTFGFICSLARSQVSSKSLAPGVFLFVPFQNVSDTFQPDDKEPDHQSISDQLINRYNNAQENVCKLKPIIEFLQADKTRRELTGT